MGIVHISSPGKLTSDQFGTRVTPPAVGTFPSPRLATRPAYDAPDDSVSTGTWEATPGVFSRAIMDAEFSHFLSGHATFVAATGESFEFRGGDAAYFPPNTKGVWTIHETLRKTFCVWR